MEDGPRYLTIHIDPFHVEDDIRKVLRPGDRIVSVFPVTIGSTLFAGVQLSAIIECRHPSWAAEGKGWIAGVEHADEEP